MGDEYDNVMAVPKELLDEIQRLLKKPAEWFSIPEIQKQRPQLLANKYSHQPDQIRRDLERVAADLLERGLRKYEAKIAQVLADNAVISSPEDDAALVRGIADYAATAVGEIQNEINKFVARPDHELVGAWSTLDETGKRIASELSVTVRLAGELSRLEILDAAPEDSMGSGSAQTRIERFLSQYSKIPHPFDPSRQLELRPAELKNATRLLLHVVFHPVKEPRLSGFESKFVSTFMRYLNCPRDLSMSAVEQVAALFEPFLKKLAFLFLFDVRDSANNPIWRNGLDGLIRGLGLTTADLRQTQEDRWKNQNVEAAVLRVAYQLRHKGAHEAHEYPFYERERNAYFIFSALLIVARIMIATRPEAAAAIARQNDVDSLRDLFVKVEELLEGPYGPRTHTEAPAVPSRLDKLLALTRRAQAIWPTSSHQLLQGLESEYFSVRDGLIESDREAEIESYLEDMREREY